MSWNSDFDTSYQSITNSEKDIKKIEWTTDYTKTFDEEGRELSISLQIGGRLKDEDTILHFEYYNTEEVLPNNLHREYSLITEGLSTSQPSDKIVDKWIDSLVGYDEQKTLLPVTTLSPARRYGILDNPLQTMFVNKTEALKQVIERINLVLAKSSPIGIDTIEDYRRAKNLLETKN